MPAPLDDTDTRLIRLLQEDSSRTVKSLAARLGLSIATVHRRREALRARGVIRRFTVEVDPARAGRPALFLVEASLQSDDDEAVGDFKRRVRECPDVVECYHLMGDGSFLLVIALATRADLTAFSHWLSTDGVCAVRIRTSPVLDQVKPALGRASPRRPTEGTGRDTRPMTGSRR